MKIGVDISTLLQPFRTGVGEYTRGLLTALIENSSHEYHLWYNSAKDTPILPEGWQKKNVRLHVTRWPNKIANTSFLLFQWPKLGRACDWWFSPNMNFTALDPRARSILTIHDLSFIFFPDCFGIKQRLWHAAIRPRRQLLRANIILTPSENTKRDIIEYYDIDHSRIHVLRPGLSWDFHHEGETAICEKLPEKYMLFVGTIEPRKNVDAVIDAFLLAKKNNPELREYRLVLAGHAGYQSHKIFARISKLSDVVYLGYVSAQDKPVLYRRADVFLYPSLHEGFGFPVLEAMSCGVPVVTSNRSSLPEVVGDAGILVNPQNIADIAKGVGEAIGDSRRYDLVARGKKRAERFEWQTTAKEFLALLYENDRH